MSNQKDKTEETTKDGNKNGGGSGSGTTPKRPKPSSVHNGIVVSKEEDAWFGKPAVKNPPMNDIKMSTNDEDWFNDNDSFDGGQANDEIGREPAGVKIPATGKNAKMTDGFSFSESDSNGGD